ncbi:hypothetical protein DT256_12275 [Lactiplantibacillus plantarum]|jgi:hypothetical protein|nr:hypothetical protein L103_04312 [Lactiplantibacillus plantarum IPLA88]RCI89204.1 hypothetical protein DT256_12275 [Lactiplantibacillus plantarum]
MNRSKKIALNKVLEIVFLFLIATLVLLYKLNFVSFSIAITVVLISCFIYFGLIFYRLLLKK